MAPIPSSVAGTFYVPGVGAMQMKKITVLLFALCVLATACQSTKGLSEDLSIETPPVADTATHVLESIVGLAPKQTEQTPVPIAVQTKQTTAQVEQTEQALALGAVDAKQVTTKQATPTLKSANQYIDEKRDENPKTKNIDAKASNDKANVLRVVHEGQLDSRDDFISIKSTSDKNDTTAVLIDASAYIQVKDTARDTPMKTPTNGQVEPIKISSLTIAEQNNDEQNDDAQKKEEKAVVMWVGEHGQMLAALDDAGDAPIADYKEITAFLRCTRNGYANI